MIPQWYFGPAGDLRSLPPPDMGIGNSVKRLGTIHETLSGRRVSDNFGYLGQYNFRIAWIEPDEYVWFEALYTHMLEPPYYLLDPLRVNMLSRYSAGSKFNQYGGKGPTALDGFIDTERQHPPVSWTDAEVGWYDYSANSRLVWDKGDPAPVTPGSDVTFSVYVWPGVASVGVSSGLVGKSVDGVSVDIPGGVNTYAADQWNRLVQSFTIPSNVVTVYPYVSTDTGAGSSWWAAPQLEPGAQATEAKPGGGAPQVLFQDMQTTSPRYPYQHISISLLEV